MLKICPQNEGGSLWKFGICRWQEGMVVIDRIFCERDKNYLLNLLVFKQAMMSKYMKYELWGFIKI